MTSHRDPTLLPVVNCNGKYAYFNSVSGDLVSEFEYDNCGDFSLGRATVSKSGYSFVVDSELRKISRSFENLGNPYDGRAVFSENGRTGVVIEDGEEVYIPRAEQLSYYSSGFIAFKSQGLWGVLDSNFDVIIEPTWKNLSAVKCGISVGFCADGTTEIYSIIHGSLFRGRVRAVSAITPDLVVAFQGREVTGKGFGIFDLSSRELIKTEFASIGTFNHGCAPVFFDGLWGYIGPNGLIKTQFRFLDASEFSDGIARVQISSQKDWHLLNLRFEVLGQRGYKYIESMISGFSRYSESQPSIEQSKWLFGYVGIDGEVFLGLKHFR